jgi:hypothetical protein
VLILIVARRNFEKNNEPNYWHTFDAGTAWGFLALEAHHRGLIAHAMGGFFPEVARKAFEISEEHAVITIVAVGYMGDGKELSEDLLAKENPGTRKPLSELILD